MEIVQGMDVRVILAAIAAMTAFFAGFVAIAAWSCDVRASFAGGLTAAFVVLLPASLLNQLAGVETIDPVMVLLLAIMFGSLTYRWRPGRVLVLTDKMRMK